jgi:hypothetical protein
LAIGSIHGPLGRINPNYKQAQTTCRLEIPRRVASGVQVYFAKISYKCYHYIVMDTIKDKFNNIYGSRKEGFEIGRSENTLLESLIGKTAYISREFYTFFPQDSLEQIAVNSHIDPRVLSYVLDHQGQIMTSQQRTFMNPKDTHVYATTGECGRAIEVPTKPISSILKKALTGDILTMKGVGSTWYAREHGYRSPYIPDNQGIRSSLEEIHALRKLSYYKGDGVFDLETALNEFNTSLKLIVEGVENIQVPVAVTSLKYIYSEHGELLPLDHFKKAGTLESFQNPAILSRLTDTNLRLMDLDVLNTLGYDDSIKKILMVMAKRFHKKYHPTREIFTEADYIIELIKRIVKNEMKIGLLGYELIATHWQDMIRNISLMGDRFDCEGIVFYGVFNPNLLENSVNDISDSMLSMYSIFKKTCPDLTLSDYLYAIIETFVDEFANASEYLPKLRTETDRYTISTINNEATKVYAFQKLLTRLLKIKSNLFSNSKEKDDFNKKIIQLMRVKLGFDEQRVEYIVNRGWATSMQLDRDLSI